MTQEAVETRPNQFLFHFRTRTSRVLYLRILGSSYDQTLVQRAIDQDYEAAGELLESFRAPGEKLAHYITGSREDAQDIVADSIIKALRALPDLEEGDFAKWIATIIKNTLLDHLRHHNTLQRIERSGVISPDLNRGDEPSVEAGYLRTEQIEELLYCIGQLTPNRQAVIRGDVNGLTMRETAVLINSTVPAVKSLAWRSKQQLAELQVRHFGHPTKDTSLLPSNPPGFYDLVHK